MGEDEDGSAEEPPGVRRPRWCTGGRWWCRSRNLPRAGVGAAVAEVGEW